MIHGFAMSRSLLLSVLISVFILTLFAFASREYRAAASQSALDNPFVIESAAPSKWKQPNSTPAPSSVTVSALLCNRAGVAQTDHQPIAGDSIARGPENDACPQAAQRTILPR